MQIVFEGSNALRIAAHNNEDPAPNLTIELALLERVERLEILAYILRSEADFWFGYKNNQTDLSGTEAIRCKWQVMYGARLVYYIEPDLSFCTDPVPVSGPPRLNLEAPEKQLLVNLLMVQEFKLEPVAKPSKRTFARLTCQVLDLAVRSYRAIQLENDLDFQTLIELGEALTALSNPNALSTLI